MLDLSDSHTHLEDYGDQLPQVVQRARDVGVRRIITAGSSLESSRAAVRIAEDYPDIYAGVGIHPHAAHLNITEETFEGLAGLARSSEKVLMVCEPGLDYFKSKAPRELQQDVFRRHLRLARELQLSVVFHSREAYWDCLRILKEERVYEVGAIMHYFVADQRIAEECIDMGIYVSFSKTLLSPPPPPPHSRIPAHGVHGHRDRLLPPALEKEEPSRAGPANTRRRERSPNCAVSPSRRWPLRPRPT